MLPNNFTLFFSPERYISVHLPLKLQGRNGPTTDEFTNIKKAFIYGFGLNQTIIFDPSTKSYLNINNLSTQYTISSYTLSTINEMAIYLLNNSVKNELSIIDL